MFFYVFRLSWLGSGPQDVWVPPSNGLQAAGGSWNVVVPRDQSYNFDAAVIAHNGKCAERLTSSTPAKEARLILRRL